MFDLYVFRYYFYLDYGFDDLYLDVDRYNGPLWLFDFYVACDFCQYQFIVICTDSR